MQNKKNEKVLTYLYDIFFAIMFVSLILLHSKLPVLEDFASILSTILLVLSFVLAVISGWLFYISRVKRQLILTILFFVMAIYTSIFLI